MLIWERIDIRTEHVGILLFSPAAMIVWFYFQPEMKSSSHMGNCCPIPLHLPVIFQESAICIILHVIFQRIYVVLRYFGYVFQYEAPSRAR